MKKILRLVTTSVLTLTLVACGGNSSSSQSTSTSASTSTGQSTSTSTSTTVAVTSISIASSSSLSQTLGSTSKVTVNATFNSGATQSSVDWYVNDVKQGQTGTTFEYTPTAVGSFSIVAKVGSVSSNALSLVVGSAAQDVGEPVAIDADTIELKADAGASIVVDGHDLKDSSCYSLSEGKYILELKKVLTQGETVKVTVSKDGSSVVKSFVYDLQVIEIGSVSSSGTALTAEDDGSYEITKPFYTDLTNAKQATYDIKWATDEFVGDFATEFSATAPEGATAMAATTGTQAYTDGQSLTKSFIVNKDTVSGTYTFKYKVGSKEATATIVVKDPAASIAFNQTGKLTLADGVSKAKFNVYLGTFADSDADGKFSVQADMALPTSYLSGVAANADGAYEITKPYLDADTKTFGFSFKVSNIDIASVLNVAGNTATPNRVQFTVSGPDGSIFRTATGHAQVSSLTPFLMRDSNSFAGYVAKIDNATTAGTYTITATVYQGSDIVLTKDVVIVVKDPSASLTLTPTQMADATAPNGQTLTQNATDKTLYTISKPLTITGTTLDSQTIVFNAVLSNYESVRTTSAVLANSYQSVDTTTYKDFLTYKTSATGPQSISAAYQKDTKVGIELDAGTTHTGIEAWSKATAYTYDAANDLIVYNTSDSLYYKLKANAAAGAANPTTNTTSWEKADAVAHAIGDRVYLAGAAYVVTKTMNVTTDTWDNSGVSAAKNGEADYNSEKTGGYAAAAIVIYSDGKAYKANGAVAEGVAFAIDSTAAAGATWTLYSNYSDTASYAIGDRFWSEGVCYRFITAGAASGQALTTLTLGTNYEANSAKIAASNGGSIVSDRVANTALTSSTSYSLYTDDGSKVGIYNIFSLTVDNLTSAGDYVYTVQIGDLSKTITIRVVEPATEVDFYANDILNGANSAIEDKNGVYGNADELLVMQATNEYSFIADGTSTYKSTFDFLIENMIKPTAVAGVSSLAYSIEVTTPTQYNKKSEAIAVDYATGNDGHLTTATAGALLTLIYGLDGGTDAASFEMKTVGDYTISLTIAGQTKTITIHALKDASLEVQSIKDADAHLFLDEAKGAYLVSKNVPAAGTTYSLEIAVTGAELPEGDLYYFVTTTNTKPTTGTATELEFDANGIAKIDASWVLATADMNKYKPVYIWVFDADDIADADTKLIGGYTEVPLFDLYVD